MAKKKNNSNLKYIPIKENIFTVNPKIVNGVFEFSHEEKISNLSKLLNKPTKKIIQVLKKEKITNELFIKEDLVLNVNQISELVLNLGIDFRIAKEVNELNVINYSIEKFEKNENKNFKKRPPVITIMGHVDHGKTTLLDAIRKSRLTAKEVGGITQTIGAYQIEDKNKNKITFVDTPGHEAFTEMRQNGAHITDIVILVVAADDSVMPQTRESIDHAKAAKTPIIVAINKIDAPGANPKKVKNELAGLNVVAEELGGDVPFVEVSALKNKNINKLLESITLVADVIGLKSDYNHHGYATILEAHVDKFLGPVANVIVSNGEMNKTDFVLSGEVTGKIKRMVDENGRDLQVAKPSQPFMIVGLDNLPKIGDRIIVVDDEKFAKQVAQKNRDYNKREKLRKANKPLTLQNISERLANSQLKQFNIILKGDTQGRVEAISNKIRNLSTKDISVNLLSSEVGAVTSGDLTLGKTAKAVIYMFGIKPTTTVIKELNQNGITYRTHDIIYKLIEEVEDVIKGMKEPVFKEVILGEAEIKKIYTFSKLGSIAGSYMREGKIERNSLVRVLRDSKVVYEGEVNTLKQEKNDVKEVTKGKEFGFTIKGFNDIKEGDIAQLYVMEQE